MLLFNLKKTIPVILVAGIFYFPINSQEILENTSNEESLDYSFSNGSSSEDGFDDIFSDASDSDSAIVKEEDESGTSLTIGSLSIPLKMSGDLNAEVGAAYTWRDELSSGSAYFDLENYLYFTTRPDKYIALKGALKTSMPKTEEADDDGQNHYFYLYELYFDYLMANRIYITAGKKKTTWGNIRLFSNDENFESDDVPTESSDDSDEDSETEVDEEAICTNVLYDSRYNISGIIRVPFGTSTFTLLTMYRGNAEKATYRDMSFAGNAEFILFNTSLNLFGRTFPSKYGNNGKQYRLPIIGAEVKRTLFGFDFYAQEIARVESNETLRQFWKSKLYKKSAFEKFIFTGGFYRLWATSFPYVGINAEYQHIYYPVDNFVETTKGDSVISTKTHNAGSCQNRFIVDFGLAKLGKDRNLKFGVQWLHNITEKEGYVKPGFIISRIFPHCDLRIGGRYDYGEQYEHGKVTLGSYFKISLDY